MLSRAAEGAPTDARAKTLNAADLQAFVDRLPGLFGVGLDGLERSALTWRRISSRTSLAKRVRRS